MAPKLYKKRKAVATKKHVLTTGKAPMRSSTDIKSQDPRSHGVDPKVLRKYEKAMQELVRRGKIAGCSSVVLRKDQVVHVGSWGLADIEGKTRFTPDTYCRLYCMTKSYVASTFMTLVDEGLADLEDRLDKYLPEFANPRVQTSGSDKTVKANKPILMKHVLSHTSGIDYPPDLGTEPDSKAAQTYLNLQKAVQQGSIRTLKGFVRQLANAPLSCHPGEGYYYGFSMDVIARVVEVIMGKNLEQCIKERIFDPLGMSSTKWRVPDSELQRLAALYAGPTTWGNLYGASKKLKPVTPKKGLVRIDGNRPKESHWRAGNECAVLSGGGFMGYLYGGLVSTVADTVKFVRMWVKRGVTESGERLLKEKTIALMERDRLKEKWGSGRACYIGNKGVFREGGDEFGMGGAACTYWSIDREDDVSIVWFTQNVEMADLDEPGMPANVDLWKLMHETTTKKKRKSSSS